MNMDDYVREAERSATRASDTMVQTESRRVHAEVAKVWVSLAELALKRERR